MGIASHNQRVAILANCPDRRHQSARGPIHQKSSEARPKAISRQRFGRRDRALGSRPIIQPIQFC